MSNPARARFGGATAIAVAFAVYALVTFGGGVALGGPADLDTSWNVDGLAEKVVPTGTNQSADAADGVMQTDGRFVVAGVANGDLTAVRFNADGSVDNGFGTNGVATADFGTTPGGAERPVVGGVVALDSSNPQKIVVVGGVDTRTSEGAEFAIARFTDGGALDPTFSPGGDPGDGMLTSDILPTDDSSEHAGDVHVFADGKILVGGSSYLLSVNQERTVFARYQTNGNLDTTFSGDGQSVVPIAGYSGINDMVVDVTAQTVTAAMNDFPGGEPFTAGRFFLDHPSNDSLDGTLDPSFGGDGALPDGIAQIDVGGFRQQARAVKIDSGGNVVLAGGTEIPTSFGSNSDFGLARLAPDGDPDPTFSGDGEQTTSFGTTGFNGTFANDLAFQGTQIVAAGVTDVCDFNTTFAIARYNANGALDTGFSGDGRSIAGPPAFSVAEAILQTTGGKIVVGGDLFDVDDKFVLARYGTATADSEPGFCPTSLTVHLAGSGTGTVTGDGINCPSDCVEANDPGNTFDILEATPAAGSSFAGWSGNPDCVPPEDPECFIDIGTDTHVTANFALGGTTTTTTTTTPTTTTTATDTDPPETTITKGPKKKTTKSKAKLKFSSDEPGSTFECLLKGKKVKKKLKKFKPCAGKAKYKKLKPGKKQFQVRATDPAGNVDPTPAKKKWKVKPKP